MVLSAVYSQVNIPALTVLFLRLYIYIYIYIYIYFKFKLSNQKTLFVPRDNVIFHCISLNPTRTACAIEYICISWQHTCVPRVAMKYKIYSMARVGSTNFKITKMAG